MTTVKKELIALEIAHHSFVADDGYLSTAIHDNEQAADIVVEWLAKHDREVAARAWDEGATDEARAAGFEPALELNPYRDTPPVPNTKEENIAFRKAWDARVDEGKGTA